VFSNADWYDTVLMILGTLGGAAVGVSLPLFNVLFGQILDKLNGDSGSFAEKINTLCLIMVYVAIGNLFAGFAQVINPLYNCW
jgi:hypothetical protein